MIVCVCNAITERDIEEAVDDGADSLHTLQQMLPVANQCGSCRCCAEACVESTVDKRLRAQAQTPVTAALVPMPVASLATS